MITVENHTSNQKESTQKDSKAKHMNKIKFGTDGWRAIIADDYTVANVKRVAEATAQWLKKNDGNKVVIGHDCRFGGQLFC